MKKRILIGLLLLLASIPDTLFAPEDKKGELKRRYLSAPASYLAKESQRIKNSIPLVGGLTLEVYLFKCGVTYESCQRQLESKGIELETWDKAALVAKIARDKAEGKRYLIIPPEGGNSPLTTSGYRIASGNTEDGMTVFLASHFYDEKKKKWSPLVHVRFILPAPPQGE